MKISFLAAAIFMTFAATAQDSVQTINSTNPLTISGYVEGYYSYDFNQPSNNNRPDFLYNFNRHNEFTINLGFIKAAYVTERTRANLAAGVGTYMNANYAAEPGVLKYILEANAGYKLSSKNNLWFDIGILPSHIGFESAIGKDNWTLTRSLVAENTPYFESGAKLTYTTKDGKLLVSAMALNGWQRISRVDGNSLMSWGTQVTYKPTDKFTFNYSTFIGTDKPDTARLWRYHNNLYGIFQITDKVGLIANLDYGLEQNSPNSNKLNQWYTPVAILRITPNSNWAIAIRGEYFSDQNGVIIGTGTANGFKTFSGSVNLDYRPLPAILLRIEGRHMNSKDAIFTKENMARNNNSAISFSTSIAF
ncbi:porin [Flavihumibacter sp. UBA7668]|uniref:porin n=1 Tax=Flavihumibacter sp. UBA7668 TaxID=1946542 RepID=UPI0025C07217|nr:porin [Flavihumibacter sp. UBA7668]